MTFDEQFPMLAAAPPKPAPAPKPPPAHGAQTVPSQGLSPAGALTVGAVGGAIVLAGVWWATGKALDHAWDHVKKKKRHERSGG